MAAGFSGGADGSVRAPHSPVLLLAYVLAPVFQRLLYECHELVGYCAVDYAVIVAES